MAQGHRGYGLRTARKSVKTVRRPSAKKKKEIYNSVLCNTNWKKQKKNWLYFPSGYTANCIGLSQADAWINTFVCDAYLTKDRKHENTLRYYAIK